MVRTIEIFIESLEEEKKSFSDHIEKMKKLSDQFRKEFKDSQELELTYLYTSVSRHISESESCLLEMDLRIKQWKEVLSAVKAE